VTQKTLPELRRELAGERTLSKLGPAEQTRLLELILEARQRQHRQIRAAMEGALEFIPALLRGPVRALFR
jgi:hypothetical protein